MSEESVAEVLREVADERRRQEEKWGEQNHPDVLPGWHVDDFGIPTQEQAKRVTDVRAERGTLAYADILIEELCEAVEAACEGDKGELRAELIQVAAVAVAWVEKLDREVLA